MKPSLWHFHMNDLPPAWTETIEWREGQPPDGITGRFVVLISAGQERFTAVMWRLVEGHELVNTERRQLPAAWKPIAWTLMPEGPKELRHGS